MRPLALLLVLALAACGGGADADEPTAPSAAEFRCPDDVGAGPEIDLDGRPLRVVTTVAPITSIVANVAGDAAEVRGLVPEGNDSHTFEPKPSAARDLAEADVVVVNGLGLEDPTIAMAEARLRDDARLVEIGTLTLPSEQYLYDRSFPRDGGRPNPHLWTNPPMARCYAEVAARVLGSADPANTLVYEANLAAYVERVDALDEAMRAASETVPAEHRALLTYHDAWAYMAAHYGWEVIGAIQVSSFEDPTPREVARLIDQVRDSGVPAIFGSEVFPSSVLERIGEETGVRYIDELRDDDLPGEPGDPEHSFLGLLRFDFVTMVGSLGGDPSALESVDVSDVAPDRATYPQ